MKVPAILGMSAIAILAVAGCSSSPQSGTETFTGTTHSTANAPKVPISATGIISDTGSITLGGGNGAGKGTFHLSKGSITVMHSKPAGGQPQVNQSNCAVAFRDHGTYTILSGTGSYAGITGHGTFKVTFAGTAPRKHNGKCNTGQNAKPLQGTSSTVFYATGPAKL
jgi:hypothetical protein